MPPTARPAAVVAGFAVIYIVWGTTYLGIHYAVEAMPPVLSAALRFLLAGIPLYAVLRLRGGPVPQAADWLRALVVGGLMLTLGNGMVSMGATRVPSGITALLVATVPLWVTVFQAAGDRRLPRPMAWAAIVVGLAGVAILTQGGDGWKGGLSYLHVAFVLLASMSWALGTVISRRRSASVPLLQDAAMQMLAGGAALLLWSAAMGELRGWDAAAVPVSGWAAVLYLTLFGSVLALSTYLWLLRHVPAPRVATYAFVNPVVAVALGAVWLGEPVGWRIVVAAALIVAAVAMAMLPARAPLPAPAGQRAPQ